MDNLVVAISWHVYYAISFLEIEKPSTVRGRCDEADNRSNIQYLQSALKMVDKLKCKRPRIAFFTYILYMIYVYFFQSILYLIRKGLLSGHVSFIRLYSDFALVNWEDQAHSMSRLTDSDICFLTYRYFW